MYFEWGDFFQGDFSLEGEDTLLQNHPVHMISFTVKENLISPTLDEILRYRKTDKHNVTFILKLLSCEYETIVVVRIWRSDATPMFVYEILLLV